MSLLKNIALSVLISSVPGISFAETHSEELSKKTSGDTAEKDPISSLMEGLNDEQQLDMIAEVGEPLILDNFTTGEKDTIEYPHRLTAEQAVNYVPPFEELRGAFFQLVDEGTHPFAAALEANMMAMEILTKGS